MEVASLKEIEFLKDLSDYKISLLKEYMNFTLEENKKFNLTSLDSEDEFIVKNILDSLLVVKFIQDDFSNKRVVDIGSGAGLPGIPLAIYYPNTKFYLLEPTTKRASFLKRAIEFLKLENVEVINERAELLVYFLIGYIQEGLVYQKQCRHGFLSIRAERRYRLGHKARIDISIRGQIILEYRIIRDPQYRQQ